MSVSEKVLHFMKMCKGFDNVLKKVNIVTAGGGSCIGEFTVEEEHTNFIGSLHGGFSATLVDVISSLALLTHEKGECVHVSVNMNISYHKAAKIGDEVVVDARTLRAGANLAFLEVDIKNKQSGELLVKGSHTKFLVNNSESIIKKIL